MESIGNDENYSKNLRGCYVLTIKFVTPYQKIISDNPMKHIKKKKKKKRKIKVKN